MVKSFYGSWLLALGSWLLALEPCQKTKDKSKGHRIEARAIRIDSMALGSCKSQEPRAMIQGPYNIALALVLLTPGLDIQLWTINRQQ